MPVTELGEQLAHMPTHFLVLVVEQAHQCAGTGARIITRDIMREDARGAAAPRRPSYDRLIGHFPSYLNILLGEHVCGESRDTRDLGAALLVTLVSLFH